MTGFYRSYFFGTVVSRRDYIGSPATNMYYVAEKGFDKVAYEFNAIKHALTIKIIFASMYKGIPVTYYFSYFTQVVLVELKYWIQFSAIIYYQVVPPNRLEVRLLL